ncbi:MAG: hypothetical protein LBU83_06925 [Bacteroidales bacterium]|jgi:hypothetical protein|nr:hypothetical protein [Bacteroidales bacterium]
MKKILITLFCVFWALFSYGQLALSQNQQLIEDAVKEGVFIIQRCYQLQDTTAETPVYYGWNNLPYFGETFSLGIRTTDGYYFNNKAYHPWNYDAKFEEYEQSNQFAPIISASRYKMADDSIYKTLPFKDIPITEISTHRFYLAQDSVTFNKKGFSVDFSNGVKKGWLVWLVTDKPLEEKNDQTPTFIIYRSELNFEQGKETYEIKDPATQKAIVGGFYIVPEVNEIGKITFHLSGLMNNENDKWQVVRINSYANTNVIRTQSQDSNLTPIDINSNNSNKNNNNKKNR